MITMSLIGLILSCVTIQINDWIGDEMVCACVSGQVGFASSQAVATDCQKHCQEQLQQGREGMCMQYASHPNKLSCNTM